MVGVPGRSKGCDTCRKRRIACSLERPHCQQCVKSKRACPGYQKDRIFVTSTTSTPSNGKRWRQSAYQAPLTDAETQPMLKHRQGPVSLLSIIGSASLEKTAAKQQTIGTVLGGLQGAVVLEGDGSHWLSKLSGQMVASEALEASILALCSARLARSATALGDRRLERASSECYGNALCAVRRAVGSPQRAYDAETLGACWVLAMYEVFECPGQARTAYVRHVHGCAKLVELRGPEAHQEGMAHTIFLAVRTMGALEALVQRRTFLSRPEWRTVPFAKVKKSHFDLLVDIILDGPALHRQAEQLELMDSPQGVIFAATKLVQSCSKAATALHRLYKDMNRSVSGPLYWPVFSKLDGVLWDAPDCEDLEDLFPVQHEFVNIRIATTLALYWGVLVMIHSATGHLLKQIKHLQAAIEPAGLPTACLPQEQDIDFMPAARNVCQSVQYCMQHDLGLPFIMGPLNMVIQTLKGRPGCEREVRWARRALQLVKLKGVQMADHLPQDGDRLYEGPQ